VQELCADEVSFTAEWAEMQRVLDGS
jgi:hypothetical protein